MKIDFKDKVVIITGALGAIGKVAALKFAENGANVVLCDVNEKDYEIVINDIKAFGVDALFIKVDLGDPNQASGIAQKAIEKFGKIDILINNAGTNVSPDGRKPIHEFSEENWDKIISIDLSGVYHCSKPIIKHMVERKYGKIINIGSIAGLVPLRMQCAFVAAKAAVHALTKAMAIELAPFGINVNAIAPGSIMTEHNKQFFYSDPEKAESLLSHIPLHRPGEPINIANTMLFMTSDEACYMTGSVVVVDGGWTCGYTRDW